MEKLIKAIVDPIITNHDALMIKTMPPANGEPLEIIIIAEKGDIARLIGKGGIIANAIREVTFVKSRLDEIKVRVRFESYDE